MLTMFAKTIFETSLSLLSKLCKTKIDGVFLLQSTNVSKTPNLNTSWPLFKEQAKIVDTSRFRSARLVTTATTISTITKQPYSKLDKLWQKPFSTL